MNEYKLTFDVWKENPEPFTERETIDLINIAQVCRMGKYIKFDKYGEFSFDSDDIRKINPTVVEKESFIKKNTNCIIFNVDIPKCPFNKMFVYQYKSGIKGFYGYYLCSDNNEMHIHKYYIEHELNRLMLSMNNTIYELDVKYNVR